MVTFSLPLISNESQILEPFGALEPSLDVDMPPHGVPESKPLPVGNGGGSLNLCLGGGVGAEEDGALPFSSFLDFVSSCSAVLECVGAATICPLEVGGIAVAGGAGYEFLDDLISWGGPERELGGMRGGCDVAGVGSIKLLIDGDALARFTKWGVGDTGGASTVDPRIGSNICPLLAGRVWGVGVVGP